ncbi:MAG: 5-oxoprolinase, partial [Actinomycetia bacterium]|nr:5-oxoprolinase [Actinomycetes bacterium]
GPASYGRGGPLTVTDANVMVGKLHARHFPAVFGPDGDAPLDVGAVHEQFESVAAQIAKATGVDSVPPEEVAEGFLRVSVENMANAIKKISVERGYDVTEYTLNTFGGAGGQHACAVADRLGMNRVMLHPFAGVLSAYGMGLAEVRSIRERQLELPLEPRSMGSLDLAVAELSDQIRADLAAQDVPQDAVSVLPRVNLRYAGTDTSLPIDPDADIEVMVGRFEQTHRQRFGYIAPDRDLVLEAATVEGVGRERD